jgi:hypothetical protein
MRPRADHLTPLTSFPPFDRLRPHQLASVAAHTDRLRVPAGTVLARAGWSAREVLLVLDGEVLPVDDGRGPDSYGAGSQIGSAELLAGAAHPVTLVAGEDLEVLAVYGPAYRWAAQHRGEPGAGGGAAAGSPDHDARGAAADNEPGRRQPQLEDWSGRAGRDRVASPA